MRDYITCLKICLAVDKFTIESVLGFDLNVDITDMNGKPLSKGVKVSAIPTVFTEKITTRIVDKSFFTHFNEDLLNKIRQHRRLTD
jgi:hypothetical protein